MTDILKKIKEWEFSNKDSSVTLNLDYVELAEISDVVDRKLWFNSEVDESIVETVVYNILRYNAQDKGIPVGKRKPIYLYISSIGGDTIAGLSLISAIQTSKTPIYTVVLGNAESMALVISIMGHKRYAMPNAVYLMHEGFVGDANSTGKVRDRVIFVTGEQEDKIRDMVLTHTNLTKKQYDDKYRKEWYFFPDTAKKYGFVDYIIGEDCELEEII